MTTEGSIEACGDVTKVKFRAQGLMDEMERIRVAVVRKSQEVMEAASRAVDIAMRALNARGPDPDAPVYPRSRDSDRILEGLVAELVELRRRPGNFGGVSGDDGNWKTIAMFVLGILQVVILGFLSYLHTTVVQTHEDVTVIKCKLDPQCRIVVSNAKP